MFFKKKKKIKIDWIFLGLGNPGAEYAKTRHNIGWMAAEEFLRRRGGEFVFRVDYYDAIVKYAGKNVAVAVPLTYMNNSGKAARALLKRYEASPERLVVILDEYNFPLGKVHLKRGGGDGGHNGAASVIEYLGSREFYRLRCGIDRKFGEGELVDYVLSDFAEDEIEARDATIRKAADVLEALLKTGPARAMSLANSEELWRK